MKKIFLPITILTVVLVIAGILVYQTGTLGNSDFNRVSEMLHVCIISILFIMGIIFGIKRIISGKNGYPEEDELSKKIIQKAAALSYYLSLIIWLILLLIKDFWPYNFWILYSYGFIGMALVFIASWFALNFTGVRNE